MIPSAAVLVIITLAVLLAAALAWVIAAAYQRRMLALMRTSVPPQADAPVAAATLPAPRAAATASTAVDFARNRRASTRLMLTLAAISLLIALTQSWLDLLFVYTNRELSVDRLLVLGAIYAWPIPLAWGLARRWTWRRIVGGIAVYMAAMLALVVIDSDASRSLSDAGDWLFSQVAIPMMITLLLGASGRIRALAPYLLPQVLLLGGASLLTWQLGPYFAAEDAAPAWLVDLLYAVLPWLLFAWPALWLGRLLAGAYRAKRFSDLSYLVAVYWFLILFASALPAMESVGWAAYIQLVSWFWLPATLLLLRGALTPPPGAPTLLVLRVFQRDAQVERLFDQVIERWRLTGNTVLIAGTDLLSRTLDADDLFVYLDGRLAERFIASPEHVAERIAGFDWQPDPDGRYRVNECYCFDGTWQAALGALVTHANVVLMDLRGFHAQNLGCRHELGVLAGAGHLRRVVVLFDGETDRAVAEADVGSTGSAAAAGRFHWLPAARLDDAMAERVLAALFGAAA
jgi:hypothetical protein